MGDEEADKLAKEGTNGVPSDQTVGSTFVVGKEAIRSDLRQTPEQEEDLWMLSPVQDPNEWTSVK